MAIYEYQAVTSGGRLMKGTLEAGDPVGARSILEGMQLAVQSITPAPPAKPSAALGRNEFLLFNQQLASLTQAGIPLERGLRELCRDVHSARLRQAIGAIAGDLEAGVSIDQAFAARGAAFPPLYGEILKAGVRTGRLGEMLTSLNHHLELAAQTRRIILEAMAYPLTVLALAMGVFTFVLAAVIPQFKALFADMGPGDIVGLRPHSAGTRAEPSALMKALFSASDHVGAIWIVLAALIVLAVVVWAILRRFAGGRRFLEKRLLGVPILGRLYEAGMLARLADSMALLVEAGCDLPACLRLGGTASGSEVLADESFALAEGVEKGQNLLDAGLELRVTPRLFLYSMQLGCQRNSLSDNLYGLAEMYTTQARSRQALLQSVLLPILLVVVGAAVGVVITAVFSPLIQSLDLLEKF